MLLFPTNKCGHLASTETTSLKDPVIRATFSCNLSRNNVAIESCDCLLRVLPPSRATNFYVAESKSDIYFLQHENLLREKVVIRTTNNHNLQQQHCCATSCTKCCPHYWTLTEKVYTMRIGKYLKCKAVKYQSNNISLKVYAMFLCNS